MSSPKRKHTLSQQRYVNNTIDRPSFDKKSWRNSSDIITKSERFGMKLIESENNQLNNRRPVNNVYNTNNATSTRNTMRQTGMLTNTHNTPYNINTKQNS